jgi:hypothetical protein
MRLLCFLLLVSIFLSPLQAEEWETYESEHFIFYYTPNHLNLQEMTLIACNQEDLFTRIIDILDIEFHEKITYYLYSTREYYGSIPGAYAIGTEIRFLCVFCENMCKKGLNDAHEMTHALSTKIGYQHGLLSEGLAVYVEDYRIQGKNLHCIVKILHHQGRLTPLSDILMDFWCDISFNYDIAGSFTTFLIETYGMEQFKELYGYELGWDSFMTVYGKSLEVLEAEWIAAVNEVEVTPRDFDIVRYRDLTRAGLAVYFDLGFLRVQHGTYPAHAEEGICLFRQHYNENHEEAFFYLAQFDQGMRAWKRAIETYEKALEEKNYLTKAELFKEAAQLYGTAGDEVMQVSSEENAVLFETLAAIQNQLLQRDTSSIESRLTEIEPLLREYDMEEESTIIKQQMRDISEQNYQGFEVGIFLIFLCVIIGRHMRRTSS